MRNDIWNPRRTLDGGIDYASYRKDAQALRRTARGRILTSALAAAGRGLAAAARAVLAFWNIPALGPRGGVDGGVAHRAGERR